MSGPVAFELVSDLDASAGEVWSAATTMAGVNQELRPWVSMTFPDEFADLSDAPPGSIGRVVFHSWLRAGGVVPFDRHALRLVAVEDRGALGGGFVEESTSWMQRRWRHERDVEPITDSTCVVTDRLLVVPRVAMARPVVAAVVPWLFARRHEVLRRTFGTPAAPAT